MKRSAVIALVLFGLACTRTVPPPAPVTAPAAQGTATPTGTAPAPASDSAVVVESVKPGVYATTITVTTKAPELVTTMALAATVIGIESAGQQYRAIEEHGFVETRREHVATFSIDVDRASYANLRRHVADGLVPPPDAIRIEEMVNYFTYSYPQPEGDAPFTVTAEIAGCPWNPRNRLLRVGIQGRNLDQWRMAPNNLVFLIDVSGSMSSPHKLPLLVKAFDVLIEQLRAEDRVALVVYAGAAGVVLPPTSGADKEAIRKALAQLKAGGSTAGGAGLELAYRIARENFLEDGNNRVILATDGDFNVGITEGEDLERFIEKKRATGVFLSVLGVGTNGFSDVIMETLADKGNGNYAFLDSLKEAEKVFRTELTGTLVTIAKDVKVQLVFDPEAVRAYRQIGYENRSLAKKDFDDDTKDAGELGAGHSVTALFELVPVSLARGRIGTVRLRYKDPRGTASRPIEAQIVDLGRSAYEASPDLQFAAAVAELGMLLRDSPHKGTATWDDMLHLAQVSAGPDLDGARRELIAIAEKARTLTAP